MLVKPAVQRVELLLAAQVPLADHPGDITRGFHAVGDRNLVERQAEGDGVAAGAGVQLVTKPLLIAAGHQPGPRRTAHRARDVPVAETHRAFGQRVDVRGAYVLGTLPLIADVGIPLIIREDHDDIGPIRLLGAAPSAAGATSTASATARHIRQVITSKESMKAGMERKRIDLSLSCFPAFLSGFFFH